MREKLTIIVTGYAATYPFGGATWDYLQYVLGFKRLGHRVYYLEDTGRWTWDVTQDTFSDDASQNVAYLAKWLTDWIRNWRITGPFVMCTASIMGCPRRRWPGCVSETDMFINYSGSCMLREEYMACRTKVYLDTDPLYNQAGDLDYLRGTADAETRWAVDYMCHMTHSCPLRRTSATALYHPCSTVCLAAHPPADCARLLGKALRACPGCVYHHHVVAIQ